MSSVRRGPARAHAVLTAIAVRGLLSAVAA